MFKNKSAWFSDSVPPTRFNFWMREGGTVAGWRIADYLFSEDAACPDTVRIFESRDYLWSKVTVFHGMFLSTCEKRQSVKSVSIGHYVLPPPSVQDEVRNVVGRLIWEYEDEQLSQGSSDSISCQTDNECTDTEGSSYDYESVTDSSVGEASHDYPVSNMLTVTEGYISMDKLPRYSSDLRDLHPVDLHCSSCEAHTPARTHHKKSTLKRNK